MLADRVRMILGGMKGMKTYNIELLTVGINAVEYIDFLQETGIARVPLNHYAQLCKVSRYIVFRVLPAMLMIGSNRIYINGETTYIDISAATTPGLFTHINGTAWGFTGLSSNAVFVIDLEKVAQYSGIAIENITRIKLPIDTDF
jgi:hypothetical protein